MKTTHGYNIETGKRYEIHAEPEIIIPEGIPSHSHMLDFQPWELCIFIPQPNAESQDGIYVDRNEFVNLLRANKNNPAAVQFLADMFE